MIKPGLIPRLNYHYDFDDFTTSLRGLFGKVHENGALKNIFKNDHIYFTNTARTGLRLVLDSLSLKEGAVIGVQAYNCNTVFEAIKRAGFRHQFIDVNNEFTIDINDLKKKASGLDALIITHTFGIPAQIDEIKQIMGSKPMIEDCAHAFFSRYKGNLTGTLCDAGVFSFGLAKFPSIGDGGLVVVNNEKVNVIFKDLYARLEKNSVAAEMKNILKNIFYATIHSRLIYGIFTYPFFKRQRLSRVPDKVPFAQKTGLKTNVSVFLKRLPEVENYIKLQESYAKRIMSAKKKNGVPVMEGDHQWIGPNYFMLPFKSPNRDAIIRDMLKKGVESGKHFSNSITWAQKYGYKTSSCPNAEKTILEIYTIPCHYNLKNKDLSKLIRALP